MARMIPSTIRTDVKSNAERMLYTLFQTTLPDDWVVFHSVAWQSRTAHGGAREGELDFLVVNPRYGLLALEVKGGNVSYDGESMQWMSNDSRIKDPFTQVCDNKHALLRMLSSQPFWKSKWISIGHAVAFPNSVVRQNMLRPDAPRTIILDQTNLPDIKAWIGNVFEYWQGSGSAQPTPLGMGGIDALIRLLSPSFDLRPLLGEVILVEQEDLLRATQQQFRVLDYLARHQRAAISGCAGSGKTLLAAEKARRLADQGFKVLLTCFNRNLADFLRSSLADVPAIHVIHFHGLCTELARTARILPIHNTATNDYFDTVLPELLVQAADQLKWRVDAIIVDEGQDFNETWWISLQCLLNDPDEGIFYIFYDDNQRIYTVSEGMPFGTAPIQLQENCRNTQSIYSYVSQFYQSDHRITANGPQGRDIEIVSYPSDAELRGVLRKCLNRLIIEEHVPAQDIVILTPHAIERSALWSAPLGGKIRLVDQPSSGHADVLFTTIHQYKGLESPIVILAEIDISDTTLTQLLYIGSSRACVHLIVLEKQTDE